ncbi:MAG: FAD-binding oxidoreductase [Pseudomonadota bacterium]
MLQWTDEAELGRPYWWDAAAPQPADDPLPETCDVLVIGAGYAGLSAAIAAHDAGARVAVVDAGDPGAGASTRNGGMFGAHPRLGWAALAKKFGADVADMIFAEAAPALDWAKGLIKAEGIDCDMQETGRIQLAWTPDHAESQKALAGSVTAKSEVQAHMLDRMGLKQEIGTERYHGALVFPQHCGLHPAKFHRGLRQSVEQRGVSLTGQAEVTELHRTGAGFVAKTDKGVVRAGKVVLCTNGYTTRAFRWHVARVFPLPSYLIATEALPENLIGHLAPGRRMMVETRARHSYFRVSPDGTRILWGGRASMRPMKIGEAARRLHETMAGVWPELRDVKLSHAWWGNTGYSFTHMPHVGEHRGLHYAMGFSGSGTVMAPYLGAKAAWQAVGDARGETAYSATNLTRHWLHPVSAPWFLYPADLWYRTVVDRLENWKAG